MGDKELVPQTVSGAVSVTEMKAQMFLIQNYMKDILQVDVHYGKIPGCGDKPTLLKAGAEKLMFAFNLRPEFITIIEDVDDEHRSVRVVCKILNKTTGAEVGQGAGECSTKESKWRYRVGVNEPTEHNVPKEYWKDRDVKILRAVHPSLEGQPLSTAKDENGKWKVAIKGEKVEHDNPADYYNTCLKMGKKRALVDAVISSTACSDIFTQDIEEMKENKDANAGKTVEKKKTEKKNSNGKKPKQTEVDPESTVTTAMLDRILETAGRCGWDRATLSQYVSDNFNCKSIEMTVAQANELLLAIEPSDIPV
jgi:hypothetical protein